MSEHLWVWCDDSFDPPMWAISMGASAGEDFVYLDAYPTWEQAIAATGAMIESYEREGAW